MAEPELIQLRRELQIKRLQLNAIYEFSSTLATTSGSDDILRVFFSILMGPLGLTRAFFFDKKRALFRKKGFPLSRPESQLLVRRLKQTAPPFTCARTEELPESAADVRDLLLQKGIGHLIHLSGQRRQPVILGLGRKFNRDWLSAEDEEFVFFLSRFAVIALSNVHFLKQMLEKQRMENEVSIARQIQRSLLPQELPRPPGLDIAVIYEPIRQVGGDYYDFFSREKNVMAALLVDVEGKSLPSALLAASSQAIFHAMSELYLFHPAKFIQKANDLISRLTRGQRFITLLWMLIDERAASLTYVNAGHNQPFLISGDRIRRLDRGGIFVGFSPGQVYEQETLPLKPGDVIVAFTDGVLEVQNADGREFGEQAIADFVAGKRKLPATEIAAKLYRHIQNFSQRQKFKDDFTVLIVKVREEPTP